MTALVEEESIRHTGLWFALNNDKIYFQKYQVILNRIKFESEMTKPCISNFGESDFFFFLTFSFAAGKSYFVLTKFCM